MSEKHKQQPVAWARMKHGKIISVSHDKGVAEFLAGFAASELVPLYLQPQSADAAPAVQLSDDHKALIREVFMRNGFKIKAGADDLADYVYAAAYELLQTAPTVQGEPVGYVSPRLLETLRSGKACGITMEDKPDAHNGVTIPLYTAPQPAPDVSALVEALECALETMENVDGANDCSRGIDAVEEALAAYRNQGGDA